MSLTNLPFAQLNVPLPTELGKYLPTAAMLFLLKIANK